MVNQKKLDCLNGEKCVFRCKKRWKTHDLTMLRSRQLWDFFRNIKKSVISIDLALPFEVKLNKKSIEKGTKRILEKAKKRSSESRYLPSTSCKKVISHSTSFKG